MENKKKSSSIRDCFVPRNDGVLKQSEFDEGDCFPEESGQAVVPLREIGAGSRNDNLLKGNDANGKRNDDLLKRNEGKTPNSKPLTPNLTLILKSLCF